MPVRFNTSGGGGVSSSDVTASRANVLQGFKTITTDSNDEVVEGLIPNLGSGSNSLGSGVNISANHYFMDIPAGYYYGGSGSGTNTSWVQTTLPRLRQDIGATNPAKWLNDTTIAGLRGTMPNYPAGQKAIIQGINGQGLYFYFNPGYYQTDGYTGAWIYRTLAEARSADPNFIASNIKKNAVIFGLKGTAEGWVPEPTDLYYNGVNSAGFTGSGNVRFENTRIYITSAAENIYFHSAIDVRSFTRLNFSGYFTQSANRPFECHLMGYSQKYASIESGATTQFSLDITQVITIENYFKLYFTNMSPSGGTYITRIWLS